jgi:hypothetical protein
MDMKMCTLGGLSVAKNVPDWAAEWSENRLTGRKAVYIMAHGARSAFIRLPDFQSAATQKWDAGAPCNCILSEHIVFFLTGRNLGTHDAAAANR